MKVDGKPPLKFRLARVIGQQILTYKEMTTVFCQVKTILNSRPLSSICTDPYDFPALSPRHFRVEPASTLPDPNLDKEPIDHLSRWKLSQESSFKEHLNTWGITGIIIILTRFSNV